MTDSPTWPRVMIEPGGGGGGWGWWNETDPDARANGERVLCRRLAVRPTAIVVPTAGPRTHHRGGGRASFAGFTFPCSARSTATTTRHRRLGSSDRRALLRPWPVRRPVIGRRRPAANLPRLPRPGAVPHIPIQRHVCRRRHFLPSPAERLVRRRRQRLASRPASTGLNSDRSAHQPMRAWPGPPLRCAADRSRRSHQMPEATRNRGVVERRNHSDPRP